MIKDNTVFILGAGASLPYGYPSGAELRHLIAHKYAALLDNGFHEKDWDTSTYHEVLRGAQEFSEIFRKSSTPSIDLFLARNPRFEYIGKRAIICCILDAESKSKFREDINNKNWDWYSYLFQRLTEDISDPTGYKKLTENNVSFITFNYDRSLEHFICESIENSFNDRRTELNRGIYISSEKSTLDYCKPFPVLHVYGKISDLPFENPDNGWIYGKIVKDAMPIDDMIRNIRVINDRCSDGVLAQIRGKIKNADRIFFLGFGFAKENLEVLGAPDIFKHGQMIFGTVYGFEDREIFEILNKLRPGGRTKKLPDFFWGENITLVKDDSKLLLRKYLE